MSIIDNDMYTVYENKDGRTRIYDKKTHKVSSYPRYLMGVELGRPLMNNEDVHHIDGNPLNNDISNLIVIDHSEHERLHSTKYHDMEYRCSYCNQTFIWTATSQRKFYSNKRRKTNMTGPFCSKRCTALGSANEHRDRNVLSECE